MKNLGISTAVFLTRTSCIRNRLADLEEGEAALATLLVWEPLPTLDAVGAGISC